MHCQEARGLTNRLKCQNKRPVTPRALCPVTGLVCSCFPLRANTTAYEADRLAPHHARIIRRIPCCAYLRPVCPSVWHDPCAHLAFRPLLYCLPNNRAGSNRTLRPWAKLTQRDQATGWPSSQLATHGVPHPQTHTNGKGARGTMVAGAVCHACSRLLRKTSPLIHVRPGPDKGCLCKVSVASGIP